MGRLDGIWGWMKGNNDAPDRAFQDPTIAAKGDATLLPPTLRLSGLAGTGWSTKFGISPAEGDGTIIDFFGSAGLRLNSIGVRLAAPF